MLINATLLVQIFNFFVAYWVMKHILLQPALLIIKQRENEYTQLYGRIRDCERLIAEHKEAQKEQKHLFYEQFQQLIPHKIERRERKPALGLHSLVQKPHEQGRLVKELSQQLAEKILHDY